MLHISPLITKEIRLTLRRYRVEDKNLWTLYSELLVKYHTNMNFEPKSNAQTGEWETPTKTRIKVLIEEGVLSMRGAAHHFGVPKLTIHN